MYLEHFGLSEVPFRITPHTDFFFAGANRGATLEALMYAITHEEGIVKVSGEVGSGKTMLCRVLMERLPPHVTIVYLANPSLARDDILHAIADELQLEFAEQARPHALLKTLQDHLIKLYGEGKQVVVLIDEAHAMPAETLEAIRLLSNLESNRHKLMQLVLFGQPELNDVLARTDMRQLKERITHNFSLEPLVRDDIAEYIDFRLRAAGYKGPSIFAPAAIREISRASQGLTRRINILADKSLLAAFAQNTHQITARLVSAAVTDAEFGRMANTASRSWLWGVVVVLAAFGGLAWWLNMTSDGNAAQTAGSAIVQPPSSGPTIPAAWKTLGPLTQQRLRDDREWFEKTPDDHWFVQLLGTDITEARRVETTLGMLDQLLDHGDVRVYFVEMNGSQRLGIIYGDYSTRSEAAAAIKRLPHPLLANNPYPYPRQVVRLR